MLIPLAANRPPISAEIVGGATDKPIPKGKPETSTPKGQQGDKPGTGMSGLLEAKKRAQEKIREREEGKP